MMDVAAEAARLRMQGLLDGEWPTAPLPDGRIARIEDLAWGLAKITVSAPGSNCYDAVYYYGSLTFALEAWLLWRPWRGEEEPAGWYRADVSRKPERRRFLFVSGRYLFACALDGRREFFEWSDFYRDGWRCPIVARAVGTTRNMVRD